MGPMKNLSEKCFLEVNADVMIRKLLSPPNVFSSWGLPEHVSGLYNKMKIEFEIIYFNQKAGVPAMKKNLLL